MKITYIIILLMTSPFNVFAMDDPYDSEYYTLIKALDDDALNKMERLLSNGIDVNAVDIFGFTVLHRAARRKNLEAAKILLQHGAQVNQRDSSGGSALRAK